MQPLPTDESSTVIIWFPQAQGSDETIPAPVGKLNSIGEFKVYHQHIKKFFKRVSCALCMSTGIYYTFPELAKSEVEFS